MIIESDFGDIGEYLPLEADRPCGTAVKRGWGQSRHKYMVAFDRLSYDVAPYGGRPRITPGLVTP